MKTKHLFAVMVPLFLVLTFFAIYMIVQAANGPVKLSDEEVVFYKEAAVKYLNNEDVPYRSNTNESIRFIPGKNEVTVLPSNIFKESVTACYENDAFVATVNAPNVNFTGCIIIHSVLGAATLIMSILFLLASFDKTISFSKKKAQ